MENIIYGPMEISITITVILNQQLLFQHEHVHIAQQKNYYSPYPKLLKAWRFSDVLWVRVFQSNAK